MIGIVPIIIGIIILVKPSILTGLIENQKTGESYKIKANNTWIKIVGIFFIVVGVIMTLPFLGILFFTL